MTLSREPIIIQKRKPLNRVEIGTIIIRQECKCGCGCGDKLRPETMIDEHLKPLAEGGANDLDNRALLNHECAKVKTRADIRRIRKAERMAGRKGQYARRKMHGPQIKSRGFDKTLSKGFDGKVRRK